MILSWRRSFLLCFCGLPLLASLGLSQSPDKPSPEEASTRALLGLRLTFKRYVFDGKQFPACAFEQPARATALLGPHRIQTTYYDKDLRQVDRAAVPGPYAVIVQVMPKKGHSLRRYATLFRMAEKGEASWRFNPEAPEKFAARSGVGAAAVKREMPVIVAILKTRPFGQWSHDPRAARLLAGLSLDKSAAGPVHKYDDAFALERQGWVNLKRQRNGMARRYPKPFVCPLPVKGKAAPVVREGTATEAGMKPDAARKIDAVCRTWAADDDQAFAVCIVRKGVIVLHKAYGQRDGKPMTVTTKSWMASITKSLSATLMMMLVDQGLVGLDDRVEKFLPALRGIDVKTPLTIRHLYTHTNGLHKWPGWRDEMPDVAERVADYYPQLKVGKAWGYNGIGYELGGKIMENVTGEALPQLYHRHLLGPLGCTHTDVIGTHADAFSVPLDIARFGQMLLNKGAYGKKRFFQAETFEKMLPQRLEKVLGPGTKKTFGIGLDGSKERFGHGAASAATFHVDCKDQLVVIMTRNRMGKNQGKYNGKFWDAIRNGIIRP